MFSKSPVPLPNDIWQLRNLYLKKYNPALQLASKLLLILGASDTDATTPSLCMLELLVHGNDFFMRSCTTAFNSSLLL